MSGFVSNLRSEVLRLQVALYACRERLQAQTDGEALHDLRVCLRRLRSLLKPSRVLLAVTRCSSVRQRSDV